MRDNIKAIEMIKAYHTLQEDKSIEVKPLWGKDWYLVRLTDSSGKKISCIDYLPAVSGYVTEIMSAGREQEKRLIADWKNEYIERTDEEECECPVCGEQFDDALPNRCPSCGYDI